MAAGTVGIAYSQELISLTLLKFSAKYSVTGELRLVIDKIAYSSTGDNEKEQLSRFSISKCAESTPSQQAGSQLNSSQITSTLELLPL